MLGTASVFSSLRCCVVRFAGSNREYDLRDALAQSLACEASEVCIVDSEASEFPEGIDAIFLCGGFAWGDYLRAGACAARARIIPALRRHASAGMLIVGICNGFQILTEMGLLDGALMRNSHGRFICRWQELDFMLNGHSPARRLLLPIAHSDGRYVANAETLERLEREGRIFLRYRSIGERDSPNGSPNGSSHDIAGICDEHRRIFGLMPHPENAIEDFHTSRDGLILLRALLGSLSNTDTSLAA